MSVRRVSPTHGVRDRYSGSWTRGRAAVAAVPAAGWLAIAFVGSVLLRFVLSLEVHAPWIFQDEAVYSELARNLGQHGHFAIRQFPGTNGFGPLYPILLAPAWAIFSNPAHAYVAAKLINALLMSLAVVPAYVIARRLMRRRAAVVAAIFAAAIPSLAYTNTLLSENAFYPATMAAAAALVLLLERPTLLRQLAFFAFTGAAFLVRAQGVILLGAFVLAVLAAVLLDAWVDGRPSARRAANELGRYRVGLVVLVCGVGLVVAYELARGRPLSSVLGTYAGVTSMRHPLGPTLRWLLEHIGELDLYVGVIPLIAWIIVAGLGFRRRPEAPALRAFAVSSAALVLVFVVTAAVYATDVQGQRIEERYMFRVAPLLLIALVAWIDRGLPRPPVLTGAAVALGAGLVGLVQYGQLITSDVVHDAFALVPLLSLELRGTLTSQSVGVAVCFAAILAALLAVVVRPRFAWALAAVVFAYYGVIELRPIQRRILAASHDAIAAGITVRKDWVDRRVGPSTDVALLVNGGFIALPYWENQFFNRSVRSVFTLAGPFDGLPHSDVRAQPSGLILDAAGKPVRHRYVLSNYYVYPEGRALARDRGTGMTLYDTRGPLRVSGTLVGVYPDRWSGVGALWTQYACNGGTLRAHVLSDPLLFPGRQTVTAMLGQKVLGRTVIRTDRRQTVTVDLPPQRSGTCAVNFVISPTTSPAQAIGAGDMRQLGVRFLGVDYSRR